MINIAICDDTEKERKIVYEGVLKYFVNRGELCNICLFNNSKALWYEIEDGKQFDILLLDIEMPEMDGINLTYEIKQKIPESLVIFITSYKKYVFESFKVQPYRFIPKDRMENMLNDALSDAIEDINRQAGKAYIVKNQQGMEKILIKNIIYIWHRGKYAYIEKTNGENVKVRKTLKEIYQELPNEYFEWIERGCICNLAHIVRISDDCVYLTNGEIQKISRERLRETKNRLRNYVMEVE